LEPISPFRPNISRFLYGNKEPPSEESTQCVANGSEHGDSGDQGWCGSTPKLCGAHEQGCHEDPQDEAPDLDAIHNLCELRHIVCEEEHLYGRSPGPRLLRRSWLTDLLVIGRGDEPRRGSSDLGRTAEFLLSDLV